MRDFLNNLKKKAMGLYFRAKAKIETAKDKLAAVSGEGYVDTAVKIIIGVVVGAVVLGGLYLLATKVTGTMDTKVNDMFSYSGRSHSGGTGK